MITTWKRDRFVVKTAESLKTEQRYIVLRIPAGTNVNQLNTKCRAAQAEVIAIFSETGKKCTKAYSKWKFPLYFEPRFAYEVGRTVVPDFFDYNGDRICTGGIHFYRPQVFLGSVSYYGSTRWSTSYKRMAPEYRGENKAANLALKLQRKYDNARRRGKNKNDS